MELERELANSPDEVTGDSVAEQLVRTIRKIAQVRTRIDAIAVVTAELSESEFFQLRARGREAKDSGRDLFAEMAAEVDAEIEAARVRLNELAA